MLLRRTSLGKDAITDFSTSAGTPDRQWPLSPSTQKLLIHAVRFPSLHPFKKLADRRDVLEEIFATVRLWRRMVQIKTRLSLGTTRIVREENRRAELAAILGLSPELILFVLSIRVTMPIYYGYKIIVSIVILLEM